MSCLFTASYLFWVLGAIFLEFVLAKPLGLVVVWHWIRD